ncbi:hypothetical protein H0A36_09320 [Endozoicomonas sp. SM1973]|uniref:Guanylate cyclase domain-containing protein n=1 Tax=Spartinivicinus marinus TaxID=2994442 RepID=A0A853HYD7_9GAMM|nr:adenylate/guanylate cyclase domain-containing protein [Spartinivicinus marinus]MCX4028111.1 adenylate/guanylate cyclase domain-containing protein [Spartinivicinus marinus]NYZ66213.1 hypothetical protein [Spartinivicinus marinus]
MPATSAHQTSSRLMFGKMRTRVPIAYKLALILTITVTIGMVILGSIITTNQYHLMKSQVDDFGTTIVNQLAAAAQEPVFTDDVVGLKVLANNLSSEPDIKGVAIFTNTSDVLVKQGLITSVPVDGSHSTLKAAELTDGTYRLEWKQRTSRRKYTDMVSYISPIQFQEVVAGYAMVSFSQVKMLEVARSSANGIILATILLSIAMSFIAIVMGRRLSRPIHHLMDVASDALNKGDYKNNRISEDELGFLLKSLQQLGQGIDQKSQLEDVFGKVMAKDVAKQMLDKLEEVEIGGHQVEATVMFVDIVGFTSLSEKLTPPAVAMFLNEYFSYFFHCANAFNGIVDKFIGDCAMIVFGTPKSDPDHRFNAVACAVTIQQLVLKLNQERKQKGLFPVNVRIGLNDGMMLAGFLGAKERMEYTVIGDAVNIASRLCDKAQAGQIMIPASIHDHSSVNSKIVCQHHGSLSVKGKSATIDTYRVKNLRPKYQGAAKKVLYNMLKGLAN